MKTGITRAMFLGAGVSLHLPVACTYIIYMQNTEKVARWTRRCSGIALGPFAIDHHCKMQQGEGIHVCIQLGKWAVHLLSCVGCLDPEQHEESHVCWSGQRACVHPGSTQSGASLPETFPQGSGPCYSFIFLIL